ncbi:MAG: hypothetical protein D4S01_05645 [Dehalococcoidia bacterium]|nr:MAG: hypothetical protein D4S01_05645 [Dehalococcoidia bacterium]
MADDELNPEGETNGVNQTENQNPPSGEGLGESRLAELEGLLAQKDEELTKANGRIGELEQEVAESEEKLTTISDSLAEAAASYRVLVVESHPEVLEELITGDSVESINESLREAQTLVSRVRQGLETEITLARVPAGAPERASTDLSTLSPREKIQYALGGKQ